jgi:hypothetical protein
MLELLTALPVISVSDTLGGLVAPSLMARGRLPRLFWNFF